MSPHILSLIIAIIVNIIFFLIANSKKTDKFTDLSYGLTFILIAFIMLIFNRIAYGKVLLFFMIFVWAMRLILYLTERITKIKKDTRFDKIRKSPGKLFSFFFTQGIGAWLILIPTIIYISSEQLAFSIITILGFIIWLAGLIIEAKADEQKYKHKNRTKNKWIATGLWKYSRHPNYFGEILCWVGIYIFVISSVNLLKALIGLISPILIIVLLLFVTGIPKLELSYNRQYGHNPEYKKYKRTTSLLIPWFKK
jgi:steroid 5-alpha reductase family enzyme